MDDEVTPEIHTAWFTWIKTGNDARYTQLEP